MCQPGDEQIPDRRVYLLSHCKIMRGERLSEGTAYTPLHAGTILDQAQDGTEGVRILRAIT